MVGWRRSNDDDGDGELFDAARDGDAEALKKIDTPNVNARNAKGETLLHVATKYGQAKFVHRLLEMGADIFGQCSYGDSALHLACWNGDLKTVLVLLKRNPHIDCVNSDGATPLAVALRNNYDDNIVELLLEKGASVNVVSAKSNLLCEAVRSGNASNVNKLCRKGADPDLPTRNGIRPLALAARTASEDCIQALLQHGADVNRSGVNGLTALHEACMHGGQSCVAMALLEAGADPTARTWSLETPLFFAASSGNTDTCSALLGRGASLSETRWDKKGPLWIATQHGHVDTVRLLLSQNGSHDAVRGDGTVPSPLHVACLEGTARHAQIAKEMIHYYDEPLREVLPFAHGPVAEVLQSAQRAQTKRSLLLVTHRCAYYFPGYIAKTIWDFLM